MRGWHQWRAGWRSILASARERVRVPGWMRTLAGLVILAVVLGFFARQARQTWGVVRQAWQPVSWAYLGLTFVLLVIGYFILALAWYGVLRTLGGRVPLRTALRIYGLTLLPRYVPGMVWGYAGRTLLCEREGVPRRVAAGSAVVEVGLIVGTGVVVASMGYLGAGWGVVVGLPGAALLLGALWARSIHRAPYILWFRRAITWYGWALVYVGFWIAYGGASWLIVRSISTGIGASTVVDVVVSATAAWLAGFLVIFVPGGLGVREGIWALALKPIVGPAGSVFVPLVARAVNMVAEVIFSALTVLLFRGRRPPSTPSQSPLPPKPLK